MRLSHRVVAACVVLAALWAVAVFVILPAVVAGAYAGESPVPWLNDVISGQSVRSLAYYQSLARRAALLATGAAAALLIATYAMWRWRAWIATVWNRLLRSNPTSGAVDVVATGAWIGFLSGLAEAVVRTIRSANDPVEQPLMPVLWMAPLSAAMLGAFLGAFFVVLFRAGRGISLRLPVLLFASFAAYPVILALDVGIHRLAIVLLSVGIAVQAQRLVTPHAAAWTALVRRMLPWMGGGALAAGLTMTVADRMGEAAGGRPAEAPNVLLLILDTVRAEALSLYGYPRSTSPEIERLASTGVTFERAIAQAPWTLPSHASMFTGRPADSLSADFHAPLDSAARTIAEVLRDRGYATGGFVGNLTYTARSSGLQRGFAAYRDAPLSPGLFASSSFWSVSLARALRPALGIHGAVVRKSAADINREFLSWMPSDGTPFFAFLNYFDAHTPYKLEPPFDRAFRDPPPEYWRFRGWDRGYSDAQLEEFRDSYDSAIAYIDAQVGALLRTMDQRGVLRNTVVIVTSDHGEHFGEHGGIIAHGNSLYLPLLHVPLVISFPAQVPSGARVKATVSTKEIPSTILDVLGGFEATALPGRSLAEYWRPAADDVPLDTTTAIFSELTFNDFAQRSDPIQHGYMRSLVRGRHHYIRNGDGREELYDFVADPGEHVNLAMGEDSASILAPFRAILTQRGPAARTQR